MIGPDDDAVAAERRVSYQLTAQEDQIIAKACGAEEFLDNSLTIAALSELFPDEADLIPELLDSSEV